MDEKVKNYVEEEGEEERKGKRRAVKNIIKR